ncbi:hypothetical protein MKX03_025277 [Papaver bracteatum]|nr:hypothetical protein MKX03_025277 [Papaver bracteatum]
MRGGGDGELYNLKFPQNRSQLLMLLSSSNIHSSSSSAAIQNRFPSHLTRSQTQLVASKYAYSTKNVATVAPTVPINSLIVSSALPGYKVVAPSPLEPSVVQNWHLNNGNCNDGLGFNRLYVQECNTAMETHYSPVVAAIEGQGGEGLLEDAVAPRGASGGGGISNSGNDVFYQSSSPNDPYYCWTY